MSILKNRSKVHSLMARLAHGLALLGLLAVTAAGGGCGRPDDLVLVTVEGLEATITELHVTMTLDGVQAKNSQPSADDPDINSFSVFQDMTHFGVEVPAGVQTLALSVSALNTSRVTVKSATGQLDLRQTKDILLKLSP